MEFHHVPVLKNKSIEMLNIRPDGIYVDATMGGGGHSLAIAEKLTDGKLIGFDQDQNAIEASKTRLAHYQDNVTFINKNFKYIKEVLANLDIEGIDGAIMDLGVSSHQLDEKERGFSYQNDAPLDMRMDQRNTLSAYEVVNNYSLKELEDIIFRYGEERWAKRIAAFMVDCRKEKPIETTFELVSVIKKAVPKGARADGPHPAKRTFQAIRIEVNGELSILEQSVSDFVQSLNPKGRLAVITFHSLEDRIVKNVFSTLTKGCICPKELPVCVCGKTTAGKAVTSKPILPSHEELEQNPRARSAKLRVFQKN